MGDGATDDRDVLRAKREVRERRAMELVSQRWNETAENIARRTKCYAHEIRCTCCDRELHGNAIRMLELDQRHNVYHDFANVPEDHSQGWFPFGLKCGAKQVAKAREKMSK